MITSLIALLGLSGAEILVSCGTTTPAAASGDLTATSSSSGHTHQFTLTAAELASPVAISREDSTSGHTHLVTLTAGEVTLIAAGTAVTINSGSTNSHTHSYTFQKT